MDDPRTARRIGVLVLWQALALAGQVGAVVLARRESEDAALLMSACSVGLGYLTAFVVLIGRRLPRSLRNAAVACLGVTPMLQIRMIDPILMTGFDENIHVRTLRDITQSRELFLENPYLLASSRYPGMEAFVTVTHQAGIPLTIGSLLTVIAARLLLVFVLCDAVENLTGSVRAGGLAVAAYALTPHFVFWLNQFSYVTFALPLALAAVSLVARSRRSAHPGLLLAGAAVCMAALSVSHHVTSLVTCAFLAVWALIERGSARRRVALGAALGSVFTVAWTTVNYRSLRKYLDPLFEELFDSVFTRVLRVPFSNAAARVPPAWERGLIFFWAAGLCLVTLWVIVIGVRGRRRARAESGADPIPRPTLLLYLLVLLIPPVIAARALPLGRLVSDRMLDFLVLPLALLLAVELTRRLRRLSVGRHAAVGALVATGLVVGGYLVSHPAWARMPGEYIPAAEVRSIDSETVAATRWAAANLPAGSRIAGDMMGAALLSSIAGMYPVFWLNSTDSIATLYFADEWGADEQSIAKDLRLRYIYVDMRLAEEMPAVGAYFFLNERDSPQQLTVGQLSKFDGGSGIGLVYRHGPVSIYEVTTTAGTTDTAARPAVRTADPSPVLVLVAGLLGLMAGALTLTRGLRAVRSFARAAGVPLTLATLTAAVCVGSVLFIVAGVWLSPPVLISFAATFLTFVVVAHGRRPSPAARRLRVSPATALLWAAALVVSAVALTGGVHSSWTSNVHRVEEILESPAAYHRPVP